MKIKLVLFTFLIGLVASSQGLPDYELILDDDGIIIEHFDQSNTDENRFTKNNRVFQEGTSFNYAFEHLDKNGERYFFKYLDSLDNWKFISEDESDNQTHREVVISVQQGLGGFGKIYPDYSQTVIDYKYPKKDGRTKFSGASGVIENEANIWMHPPRDKYFQILELNPFPYIKTPLEIGNSWTWQLKVGDFWGDPRWKVWNGSININYNYSITGKTKLKLPIGNLECYIVEALAKSSLGESGLTAFFNPKYGFVQLNYSNIDGSKTNLILQSYYNPNDSR